MNRSLSPTELKRLHRGWRRQVPDLRIGLILDGVQNPFNVGSLFRSAAAYRVEHLWLVPPAPEPTASKVAKTALGCERLVRWSITETSAAALDAARAAGMTTVAIELTDQAQPLFDLTLSSGPVALVLGHEDRGVHRDTLSAVDHVAYLPQLGKVGSLNVAMAGTAALYEVARQAWTKDGASSS